MNRSTTNNKNNSSQQDTPVSNDQSSDNIESSFDHEVDGHVESGGPGKNILMPDIYSENSDATVPLLNILADPSEDDGESGGFNPYDTAVLVAK